jgi:polyhydroxyalkanoate synthesis regulator phasin
MARSSRESSVSRIQAAGEELVGRLWDDARALLARGTPRAATDLLAESRQIQETVRKLVLRARRQLETRREEIMSSLEAPVTRLLETVGQRLPIASREEVGDLRARIAELERRLDSLGKEMAREEDPFAAAGS